MTREEAIREIEETRQNIEDLMEARSEAWKVGRRDAYDKLTKDIRDLNREIEALTEAYLED